MAPMTRTSTAALRSNIESSTSKEANSLDPEENDEQHSCGCCRAFFRKRVPPSSQVTVVAFPSPSSTLPTKRPSESSDGARESPHIDWANANNPRAVANVVLDARVALPDSASPASAQSNSPYGGLTDPEVAPTPSAVPLPSDAAAGASPTQSTNSPTAHRLAKALFGGAPATAAAAAPARPAAVDIPNGPNGPPARRPAARHAASHSIAGQLAPGSGPRINQDKVRSRRRACCAQCAARGGPALMSMRRPGGCGPTAHLGRVG